MFVYIYTYICWNKVSLVQKKAVKRIFFSFLLIFSYCQNPEKYFRIYSHILSVGLLYLARFLFF